MENNYEGGKHAYGQSLGVMVLDTHFPRPPGDIGNARSFEYPVQYEVVTDATPVRVVREQDPALLEPFVDAADRLIDRGVVAITTTCGFLLMFQDELSNRISEVPVFSSSLLQIPLVASMIPDGQTIGIISADEVALERIDHAVLTGYEDRLATAGLSDSTRFQETIIDMDVDELDLEAVGDDVVAAARSLDERENLGAVVFECTNLRPYVDRVQQAVEVPVFDYLTLADMAWRANSGTTY